MTCRLPSHSFLVPLIPPHTHAQLLPIFSSTKKRAAGIEQRSGAEQDLARIRKHKRQPFVHFHVRKEVGEMGAQEGSRSSQPDASIPSSPADTRQYDSGPETLQGDGPEGDSDENEGRSSSPAAPEETKNDGDESVRPQALTDHSSGLADSKGGKEDNGMNGRERLKRHRVEAAGRAWIPEIWGQEELLKDWVDCSAFEASFVPAKITSAKAALVGEGRRASSGGMRIENRC